VDEFWAAIDSQLDAIERDRPSTFEGLRAVLGGSRDGAFFGGSGGDRSLLSALRVAGWRVLWMQAGYFYAVQHPVSGEVVTYIEGDVLLGNHYPLPALEVTS
jgi:hypothetical protein